MCQCLADMRNRNGIVVICDKQPFSPTPYPKEREHDDEASYYREGLRNLKSRPTNRRTKMRKTRNTPSTAAFS